MSYRTILLVIEHERDAERLIDAAIAVAKRFQAHLIGFHPELVPISYAMAAGYPDAEFLRQASERSAEATRDIARRFGARIQGAGVDSSWVSVDTLPSDAAGGALAIARSVDLVMINQSGGAETDEVGTLLHDSGRPVLVVPSTGKINGTFKRVVVGWNGSREAARAVFDSLPLLAHAEAVDVLVVDPESRPAGSRQPGESIVAALTRHGVPVQLVTLRGEAKTDDQIINHAASVNADLIVIGAYGHSWLREFFFGGVTRSLLDNSSVATFMTH